MSAIDEVREDFYWEQVGQGMIIAAKLFKARERLEQNAAHKQWEKHWRTRLAKVLCYIASRLALPEPKEVT